MTTAAGGEYDNLMASLISSLEGKFTYDNLTDYSQLGSVIGEYDVLLLAEQEWSNDTFTATVNAAWAGILPSFVANGGVVIAMAFDFGHGYTAGLINETLIDITNPAVSTGHQIDLFDATDALARNVPASYTAADGTLGFDCPDAVKVMEDNTDARPVAVHKVIGKGDVVVLGFDMYTVDAVQDTLLMNSVLLHRHIMFDDSHGQTYDILNSFDDIANDLPYYGFAVSSTDTLDAAVLASCDIFVITYASTVYNASEIELLHNFVNNGGGLFLATEYGGFGDAQDNLLNDFGFARNTTDYISDSDEYAGADINWPRFAQPDNFRMHAATLGVDVMEFYYTTGFVTIPASAVPLIVTDTDGTAKWNSGDNATGVPLAAADLVGNGRIMVLSDTALFRDVDLDGDGTSAYMDSDNELFMRNAFRWLSGAGIPEQTVVFDQSHNPYYYLWADWAPLANFLMFNGYNVEYITTFNPAGFAHADVLVICDGGITYNSTEISSITNYVANGGGLILWGDQSALSTEIDPIGQEFGLFVNTSSYLRETDDYESVTQYIIYEGNNIGNHIIMDGIERIELYLSTCMASIGSGTALLITDTDNTTYWHSGGYANGIPVCAATLYNMGRVVMLTDVNLGTIADEGDGFPCLYDADNPIFVANIFKWLGENRAPSVEVITPNGGEVLNGSITVEWNAVDFDSDPLTFEVWYTDNNGSDWNLLDDGITVDEYQWNTTLHDDGTGYMIRVVVSDGMATAQDDSDAPFELDNYVGGGPGIPLDPMMLLIIGAAVVVVIIIIVIVMKKKK